MTGLSKPDRFRIDTDAGSVTADSLVLATGGLSIPKLGASGFAYDAARQFGLQITETRPALVPLVANADDLALMRPLSGVSLPVEVRCGHAEIPGGDAVHPSRPVRPGDPAGVHPPGGRMRPILVNLLPGIDSFALLRAAKRDRARATLRSVLGGLMPQRLADALAAKWPAQELANIPDRMLATIGATLSRWAIRPKTTEGYAKAEVTLGGISTKSLHSTTLESRAVRGLYAIGEAVDVTGWLGG